MERRDPLVGVCLLQMLILGIEPHQLARLLARVGLQLAIVFVRFRPQVGQCDLDADEAAAGLAPFADSGRPAAAWAAACSSSQSANISRGASSSGKARIRWQKGIDLGRHGENSAAKRLLTFHCTTGWTGVRGQRTEDRDQRTEGTEDRGQRGQRQSSIV